MTNIILCGGSGTRLWPLSRSLYPKQFVKILKDRSLFQLTVERNRSLCDSTVIVTNEKLHFMALDQIDHESADETDISFLLEGVGRNTAPAIAIACFGLDPDECVFVTPSDHMISDTEEYHRMVTEARSAASAGMLVTFGINPSYPETGYGYIESDTAGKLFENTYRVRAFREKPDEETAKRYVQSDGYYWNSGMFVFTAGSFLNELEAYSPEIFKTSKHAYETCVVGSYNGFYSRYVPAKEMNNIPSDSIDYAVMEKSSSVAVVASDFGWNDLGSFDSLYDVLPKDSAGNTKSGNIVSVDSSNNLLISSSRKIAAVDIEDSIIIDTEDALLISKRGSSQKVKDVVGSLKDGTHHDMELTRVHTTVHRPWGSYTVLEENPSFKIKRIVVKPGHRLSLQKHLHRSEHWVVVSGTAIVQKEDAEVVISTNESTYIGIGELHRLTNRGRIPVVMIETQVGEYLEEDDIERFDDDYHRLDVE